MELPESYIPIDRRLAIARGVDLPARSSGAALFADISGFTPLTETLTRELGPQRGAEELSRQLIVIYSALIAQVEQYRGSVISFSGDAITCWFDDAERLEARDRRLGESDSAQASSLQPPASNLVEPLTAREREVLRLVADGASNGEIAEQLVIAVGTVKRHINNLFSKLGVQSRTQAVRAARDLQLF